MSKLRDVAGRLCAIECDGCLALLAPGPHVVDSGWKNYGLRDRHSGETAVWDYCSACVEVWGNSPPCK